MRKTEYIKVNTAEQGRWAHEIWWIYDPATGPAVLHLVASVGQDYWAAFLFIWKTVSVCIQHGHTHSSQSQLSLCYSSSQICPRGLWNLFNIQQTLFLSPQIAPAAADGRPTPADTAKLDIPYQLIDTFKLTQQSVLWSREVVFILKPTDW